MTSNLFQSPILLLLSDFYCDLFTIISTLGYSVFILADLLIFYSLSVFVKIMYSIQTKKARLVTCNPRNE